MMRGRIGLLVVAGVLLGAAALLFFAPPSWISLLPQALQPGATAEDPSQPAAGDSAGAAMVTAADNLRDTPQGLVASALIAAAAGNRPLFIADAISGYGPSGESAVPAEITTIRPILGCLLTRPGPGTLVGHVTAGDSGMPIGMTTYGDAQLAWAVKAYVDAYRRLGPEAEITLTGPRYEAYDVAVSDPGAPVYLVLETGGGNRIWNIHAAEGVRIERVVLLGGDQAGVANLDPVVPVEVILGSGLADCGIDPAYPPSPGQIADQTDAPGLQPMAEAGIDEILARAEAYDIWFRDSFGVLAGESRVGYDRGRMSLIGPVPAGDAPGPVWAAIDGSEIRTTHDRFLDIDGQVAQGEDFAGRVVAIVTGFALGDLERLRLGGEY